MQEQRQRTVGRGLGYQLMYSSDLSSGCSRQKWEGYLFQVLDNETQSTTQESSNARLRDDCRAGLKQGRHCRMKRPFTDIAFHRDSIFFKSSTSVSTPQTIALFLRLTQVCSLREFFLIGIGCRERTNYFSCLCFSSKLKCLWISRKYCHHLAKMK